MVSTLHISFSCTTVPMRPKANKVIVPGYTESINLMDYSAAVIPVTRADQEIDLADDAYQPLSESDRKNWEACMTVFYLSPAHLKIHFV